MLLQDSIHTEAIVAPELPDLTEHTPTRPQTPYQVLRLLPEDATPAQQDSAIQAWFQPGEIHYSSQPDTLHLPGHGIGRNLKDVNLPQYYRENFFSKSDIAAGKGINVALTVSQYHHSADAAMFRHYNDSLLPHQECAYQSGQKLLPSGECEQGPQRDIVRDKITAVLRGTDMPAMGFAIFLLYQRVRDKFV